MTEELGPWKVERGNEEKLERILSEIEQGVRESWDEKYEHDEVDVVFSISPCVEWGES